MLKKVLEVCKIRKEEMMATKEEYLRVLCEHRGVEQHSDFRLTDLRKGNAKTACVR